LKRKVIIILASIVMMIAITLAVMYIVYDREHRFQLALIHPLEDDAEMAMAMQRFGGYKNAAQYAEYYQQLADNDYASAGRTFAQYHLLDYREGDHLVYIGRNDIALRILERSMSADETLAALRDGCLAYPENNIIHTFTDDGGTRIWALKDRPNYVMDSLPGNCYSMLGFESQVDLIEACGTSPAGKLLVLYSVKGEEWGANLVAMANLGERFWPSALSEVEYILKVDYSVPEWDDAHRLSAGGTSLHWRTSTYNIALLSAASGDTLIERTISAVPPEKTEVWKDSSNYITFEPEWEALKAELNHTLEPTGAKITIRENK